MVLSPSDTSPPPPTITRAEAASVCPLSSLGHDLLLPRGVFGGPPQKQRGVPIAHHWQCCWEGKYSWKCSV